MTYLHYELFQLFVVVENWEDEIFTSESNSYCSDCTIVLLELAVVTFYGTFYGALRIKQISMHNRLTGI